MKFKVLKVSQHTSGGSSRSGNGSHTSSLFHKEITQLNTAQLMMSIKTMHQRPEIQDLGRFALQSSVKGILLHFFLSYFCCYCCSLFKSSLSFLFGIRTVRHFYINWHQQSIPRVDAGISFWRQQSCSWQLQPWSPPKSLWFRQVLQNFHLYLHAVLHIIHAASLLTYSFFAEMFTPGT